MNYIKYITEGITKKLEIKALFSENMEEICSSYLNKKEAAG
jgi:hypothetical protein